VIDRAVMKKEIKKLKDELKATKKRHAEQKTPKVEAVLEEWLILARLAGVFVQIFEEIPTVPEERVEYLDKAIAVASSIELSTRGTHLFIAVLRVVRFKAELQQEIGRDVLFESDHGRCAVKIPGVVSLAHRLRASLTAIFSDLALAFPKEKKNYAKLNKEIQSATNQIMNGFAGLDLIDDAGATAGIRLGLEEHLGMLVKCK
jgi:hypothetical protein